MNNSEKTRKVNQILKSAGVSVASVETWGVAGVTCLTGEKAQIAQAVKALHCAGLAATSGPNRIAVVWGSPA